MKIFTGIFQIFLGVIIAIAGVSLGISWLGICFGTVIIGIALLIFAPHILFLPFGIAGLGLGYIASGLCIGFNIGCIKESE